MFQTSNKAELFKKIYTVAYYPIYILYLLMVFRYHFRQQLQAIRQDRKKKEKWALDKSYLKTIPQISERLMNKLQLWPFWYNILTTMWRNLTQTLFQHCLKEHPPLLKSQDSLPHESPATSNPSLTLVSVTSIKLKILSSKRNSCPPTSAGWLTDAEHIFGLSSFNILHISCYWTTTSSPGWGQLCPVWDPLAVLAVRCKRTHLLPARGHCDCIVVTMGDMESSLGATLDEWVTLPCRHQV